MTDTVRVLATAAILSGLAIATFAWQVSRLESDDPARLIGELRLAQWAAILLAATGAIPVGLALGHPTALAGNVDAALGLVFVGVSGLVLQLDPPAALLLAASAFGAHALVDIAHRPGWLPLEVQPRWYSTACAIYDVTIAAFCFWVRRR